VAAFAMQDQAASLPLARVPKGRHSCQMSEKTKNDPAFTA